MTTTAAQIAANQLNAQKSTGPTTLAGAARSSRNACKHGLTSLTLLISPEENEAYQSHVQAYMDHHKPVDHKHAQLVQQVADSDWALHQVFVQQCNTFSLMNAINLKLSEAGDPVATAAALASVTRTLNTLSIYEGRRRRTAKALALELAEYEMEVATRPTPAPTPNKTNQLPKIGSVCSTPVPSLSQEDINRMMAETEAFLARCAAEDSQRGEGKNR